MRSKQPGVRGLVLVIALMAIDPTLLGYGLLTPLVQWVAAYFMASSSPQVKNLAVIVC